MAGEEVAPAGVVHIVAHLFEEPDDRPAVPQETNTTSENSTDNIPVIFFIFCWFLCYIDSKISTAYCYETLKDIR